MSVNTEQHINGVTPPAPKKASKLKGKDPKEAEPSKPKILIYGKPGVGKTFTSLDFPCSYLMDTEGGANRQHYTDKLKTSNGSYFGIDEGASDPVTILEQLDALRTEVHPYQTVILDSASKPFDTIAAKESERLEKEGKSDDFGKNKKPAVAWMRRVLLRAARLTNMNVIITAHQKDEWKDEKKVGEVFDLWGDKVGHELDLILQITKQGKSRYAMPIKSRLLGFPEGERFPWSYEEFATRYGKDIIEKVLPPTVIATPEQVAQVVALLDVIKIPENEIEKWFAKAKVESWAEMDSATIEKCIGFLKSKVTSA